MDNHGDLASCPNNCVGMDPNAVVTGGTALAVGGAAAGGLSTINTFQTIGAGVVGLTAVGGSVMFATGSCPPLFCKVLKNSIKTRGTELSQAQPCVGQ